MFIIKHTTPDGRSSFRECKTFDITSPTNNPELSEDVCFAVMYDSEDLVEYGDSDIVYIMSAMSGKTIEILRKHKVRSY